MQPSMPSHSSEFKFHFSKALEQCCFVWLFAEVQNKEDVLVNARLWHGLPLGLMLRIACNTCSG